MESIYWVMTWACHRRCAHCYDDRFRPYVRGALENVVGEGEAAYAKIIRNLPEDFSVEDPDAPGGRKRGQLILAGGELLLDGPRQRIFYPALELIAARWGEAAPRIGMQTTGDVLTPQLLDEMLERRVDSIAIASIDDYHVGMQGEKKFAFMEKIRLMMEKAGVSEVALGGRYDRRLNLPGNDAPPPDGPTFLFFGAQPDLWVGELWPRGRALANGLSKATYTDNFCARWSGGLKFLEHRKAGSEVSIEPDGSVYPCCLKTAAPLGNVTEERLVDILDDLREEPALAAINAGDPEAMGLDYGWSRDAFERRSETTDGKGAPFKNLCIGCDAFFKEKLGAILAERRKARLDKKAAVCA